VIDDRAGSAVSQERREKARKQTAALLRDRHHLRPEEDGDFNTPPRIRRTSSGQLEAQRTLTLLWSPSRIC